MDTEIDNQQETQQQVYNYWLFWGLNSNDVSILYGSWFYLKQLEVLTVYVLGHAPNSVVYTTSHLI